MNNASILVSRLYHKTGEQETCVTLEIFEPEERDELRATTYRFKIYGPSFETIDFYGAGIDRLDALFNTLAMARTHIDIINLDNFENKLRWLDDADPDLGLRSKWD